MGRSRGGLTTKIHARVDGQGRPIQILITPGQVHDLMATDALLANLKRGTILIADKAYGSGTFSKPVAPSPTSQT